MYILGFYAIFHCGVLRGIRHCGVLRAIRTSLIHSLSKRHGFKQQKINILNQKVTIVGYKYKTNLLFVIFGKNTS